jgi:hypothetical protein
MNWHDVHNRKREPLRQWARCADGTWYAIYPTINQGSSRWSVHRRRPGEKYDTGIGHRRTLAEARACAEADAAGELNEDEQATQRRLTGMAGA